MGANLSSTVEQNTNVVYGVCGVACLALVGLLIFIIVRRNKGYGVPGTRIVTVSGVELPADITTGDHHTAAAQDPRTIVVHHSKNCGFCAKFRPVAEEAAKATGVRVVFSEVDSSPENRSAFQSLDGVNGVPAYTIRGDKVVGIGYQDLESCKKLFKSLA